MDLELSGKVALVTGAGRGVGRGICLRLAAEGARVVVNDFHERRADRVAAEIKEQGGEALAAAADITDMGQVKAMVDKATAAFAAPDILVNNAGIPARAEGDKQAASGWVNFAESDPDGWRKIVDLNMYGTMNCTHAVLAGMVERRWGKVISVMSEAGRVGEARLAPYSGAKAAILGFSKAVAREVGKHCVNVNVVALGAVDPKGTEYDDLDDAGRARLDKLFRAYPIGRGLKRLSRPDDIADAIAFLASDRAQYITGQVLGLSGGFAMP